MSTKKENTNANNLQEGGRHSTRRAFLQDGLAAAGVIGFGFREVLARARQTGKPPFTAAGVNKLSANSSEEKYREMYQEAQQDLKAFVRKTFYLTAEQEQDLNDMTPEQVGQIQSFLNQTVEKKTRIEIAVTYGQPLRRTQNGDVLVSLPVRPERGSRAGILRKSIGLKARKAATAAQKAKEAEKIN